LKCQHTIFLADVLRGEANKLEAIDDRRVNHEGKTISKKDLRKVQDHPQKRAGYDYLFKSEA